MPPTPYCPLTRLCNVFLSRNVTLLICQLSSLELDQLGEKRVRGFSHLIINTVAISEATPFRFVLLTQGKW